MSQIVPLDTQPAQAIERLLDIAFGPDRHLRTAYRIREGMAWLPQLSFAMIDDAGGLIGTLQSWPVALIGPTGERTPLIMVGPVAVEPAHQNGGHGRALMDKVVATARETGAHPLMMIGDPEYYGRFWGFSTEHTRGWSAPGPFEPRRLLALAIDDRPIAATGMLGPRLAVAA